MNDCTPQRITTSGDVVNDLLDEIARLERELSQALAAADVEAREADSLRAQSAPREPLTDERIYELADEGVFLGNIKEIVREIEAAHGITTHKEHP